MPDLDPGYCIRRKNLKGASAPFFIFLIFISRLDKSLFCNEFPYKKNRLLTIHKPKDFVLIGERDRGDMVQHPT